MCRIVAVKNRFPECSILLLFNVDTEYENSENTEKYPFGMGRTVWDKLNRIIFVMDISYIIKKINKYAKQVY